MLEVLLEHSHGPHGTAWWVNGLQLKLGLLGKVIGFSILALEIGSIQNFDPTQSQELLRSLTEDRAVKQRLTEMLTLAPSDIAQLLEGTRAGWWENYMQETIALVERVEGFFERSDR